jgi:hypothetical protein
MYIQESKDKLGASLVDISVIEGNEETQSISDVTLMIQWHQHLCERIFNLHEGVRLRYSKAFSCINAEINAHHNQTLSLLRRNRQLADGLELMREITSAGPSDRVMTILQNTQNRLTQTQEQLYSIRSLLHLQSGSSNSTASSLSPKVETDPSTNTSATQDDSSIILKATKACDDLIDNERSLQFARLSLLAEKKMLDAAIHIGGITFSEMKALQYRVDRVGVHISKYDSRIATTKHEYENIREHLANELHLYEMTTAALIPNRVLTRQLKLFTAGNGREEIREITKSLATSSALSSPLSQVKMANVSPKKNDRKNRMASLSSSSPSPSSPSLSLSSFAAAAPLFDARLQQDTHANNVDTDMNSDSNDSSVKKGRKKLPSLSLEL